MKMDEVRPGEALPESCAHQRGWTLAPEYGAGQAQIVVLDEARPQAEGALALRSMMGRREIPVEAGRAADLRRALSGDSTCAEFSLGRSQEVETAPVGRSGLADLPARFSTGYRG